MITSGRRDQIYTNNDFYLYGNFKSNSTPTEFKPAFSHNITSRTTDYHPINCKLKLAECKAWKLPLKGNFLGKLT